MNELTYSLTRRPRCGQPPNSKIRHGPTRSPGILPIPVYFFLCLVWIYFQNYKYILNNLTKSK